MLKAFVLIFVLGQQPVALDSFDTQAQCDAALVVAKKSLTGADGALHRCISLDDFNYGLELANKRAFEQYKAQE